MSVSRYSVEKDSLVFHPSTTASPNERLIYSLKMNLFKSIMNCVVMFSLLLITSFLLESVTGSSDTYHEAHHHKRQSTPFSEDQKIDVKGDFAWVAPGPRDLYV